MKRLLFAMFLVTLACGSGSQEPRRLNLYPSPTVLPTQTPFVLQITTTPIDTQTPFVKEVTQTPSPADSLCVSATVAVYLRPTASTVNHPITPLENRTVVQDLGGRSEDGKWYFVQHGEAQGWVFAEYLSACNQIQ